MSIQLVEKAVKELAEGKMIVVVDDKERENEGDLVMSAEKITPAAVDFMAREGRGLICVPMDESETERFSMQPMTSQNTEAHRTDFMVSVDYKHGTTTGISASDRAKTIKALVSSTAKSEDFLRPGHIFPLRGRNGGVLVRAGHTEATLDLMRLAKLKPVGVICEITDDSGEMARLPYLLKFAKKHRLTILSVQDIIEYRRRKESLVQKKAETLLPTAYGDFRFMVYTSILDNKEHIVLVKGNIDPKKATLVRVHSECITGEVFHSLKCECGQQLNAAMKRISEEGSGAMVYIRQEGRGIGLVNKILKRPKNERADQGLGNAKSRSSYLDF